MHRKVAQALLGAALLAALAGCASQAPLELPDLGPPARSAQQQYPGVQPVPGIRVHYGYGYGSAIVPATTRTTTANTTATATRAITRQASSTCLTRGTCPCPAPTRMATVAVTSDRRRTAATTTTLAMAATGP